MAFSPRGELHEWSRRVDKTLDKNHTDLKDPSLHPAIKPIAPARATRKASKIIKEGTSALTPASSIKKIEDAWQREHQEWIEDSGKLDYLVASADACRAKFINWTGRELIRRGCSPIRQKCWQHFYVTSPPLIGVASSECNAVATMLIWSASFPISRHEAYMPPEQFH